MKDEGRRTRDKAQGTKDKGGTRDEEKGQRAGDYAGRMKGRRIRGEQQRTEDVG